MSVDISMLGNRELERKLQKLSNQVQKKVVRPALRKEAKRAKDRVVSNIQTKGLVKTGKMLSAFQGSKIKAASRKNFIRLGIENPTRQALGISPDDKFYYPYAVEFGHPGASPKPFIRPAIDDHKTKSISDIGRDIGSGIEREGRK